MYTIGITKADHLFEQIFDISSNRTDNYFCQLIGIDNNSSYNDTLALFNHKLSQPHQGIIFSESIANPNDPELINSILKELSTMRIGDLIHEDINLTTSSQLNAKIRYALDEIISLAIKREKFSNITIRNNFIAKLMIWSNLYLEDLDFNGVTPPKCLFYGGLKKHEAYFLMLLAKVGLDVIYFNPTKDPLLDNMEVSHLCQSIVLGNTSSELVPYNVRVAAGVVVEKVTTYARKATQELEQTLYHDTGIYKPWQFSNGTTRPLIMDSVIEDMLTYWQEPARMRPGFKTYQQTVDTPCFFSKISGTYTDINAYYTLIEQFRSAKHCLFYETPHLSSISSPQEGTLAYHNAPTVSHASTVSRFNPQDLYSLAFYLNPDQTIKHKEIKQHILYQRMLSLRTELQTFILSKIEETFSMANSSFFQFPITDKERVRLMATVFTADEALINLIDSYDFTGDIPKIILYINSREPFNQDDALLLGLLHHIGFDLLLLSPNGANNIELVISDKFINTIKLDQFIYDLALKNPEKSKKGFLFSKLFR